MPSLRFVPQGVLITHRAVVSTVAAQIEYLSMVGPSMGGGLSPDDVMLSYLPLAHIFDRRAFSLQRKQGACRCSKTRRILWMPLPAR